MKGFDKLLNAVLTFMEENPDLIAQGMNKFVEDHPELVEKMIAERDLRNSKKDQTLGRTQT